jgi:6-pyruvoyl-tetrahydropterin synthase
MVYRKVVWVQAAHFNGPRTYENYERARECQDAGDYEGACALLRDVLGDVHGHNFRVTVEAEGRCADSGGWGDPSLLVDDERLESLVLEWQNHNLSLLDELTDGGRGRATTERMAQALVAKCRKVWPEVDFTVTVEETELIRVTSSTRGSR